MTAGLHLKARRGRQEEEGGSEGGERERERERKVQLLLQLVSTAYFFSSPSTVFLLFSLFIFFFFFVFYLLSSIFGGGLKSRGSFDAVCLLVFLATFQWAPAHRAERKKGKISSKIRKRKKKREKRRRRRLCTVSMGKKERINKKKVTFYSGLWPGPTIRDRGQHNKSQKSTLTRGQQTTSLY